MTLEHPNVLKEKNRKRLRDLINITFALGINITAPSRFKDSLRIISALLIILSFGDLYGHVAFIIRHKNKIVVMAESICTLLQTVVSILKINYTVFVQYRFHLVLKKVRSHELVDQIDLLTNETPHNKELRRDAITILDNCWKIALRQFNFYMISCSLIMCYYFFGAIAINTYHSIIGNTNHTNLLAFPTLFPFWEDKMNQFPYYQILTFVVGTGTYIAGIGAVSFDGVFIILAMHAVALFRILRKMIAFTTSPHVPKELRMDYLRQCIFHYEKTYQYCVDVNNLYFELSLIQFLMSLAILGVVMFQGALGLETDVNAFLRMIVYMCAGGCQVLIYCLNGQFITSESEAIPFAWYECEWYNESREFKQLIRMMILRSNRIMIMKASGFTTMSLPTLLDIFRKSGSYFLLLRNLAF